MKHLPLRLIRNPKSAYQLCSHNPANTAGAQTSARKILWAAIWFNGLVSVLLAFSMPVMRSSLNLVDRFLFRVISLFLALCLVMRPILGRCIIPVEVLNRRDRGNSSKGLEVENDLSRKGLKGGKEVDVASGVSHWHSWTRRL